MVRLAQPLCRLRYAHLKIGDPVQLNKPILLPSSLSMLSRTYIVYVILGVSYANFKNQFYLLVLFSFSLHYRPLWEDLKHCKTPLMLIYGEKDTKFKTIAQEMFYEACHGFKSADDLWNEIHEIVEIPNCGHAAHLENPLPIISALRQFLTKLKTSSFSI